MGEREDRDTTLRELLAQNRTKHPRYRGGLANHLSMVLCSQHALGASAARMRDFAQRYGAMLDPMPQTGPAVDPKTWRTAIGHDDALSGFVKHFESDLRERGRDVVVREALDALAPTSCSAAFHCLIRTAFGVRFDDDAEIAHGLAYWAVTAESLGELKPAERRERDPKALLERVRADAALSQARMTGGSISGRMQQAAQLEGFAGVANAIEIDAETLDRIARAMLELYASTGNFTALHAVTGTHALRVLLPFANDPEGLLRHHWQALVAAFIGIGAPRAKELAAGSAPAWETIATPATASNDDHVAKLVFACHEEQAFRSGELYRFAAALRVGLV